MEEYTQRTNSITVPKNTGTEGFLHALRGILKLPRVQTIQIYASGKIEYMRYARKEEEDNPIQVDYSGLNPWSIIRHGEIEELNLEPARQKFPAPVIIAGMFDQLTREGLVPVAFVTGAGSLFWQWHEATAGLRLSRQGPVYGLPLYADQQIPDYSLILCGGYARTSLIDCHRFLSLHMQVPALSPTATHVRVLP